MDNQTPFSITLKKKAKYFKGKTYDVLVTKDGYKDMSFAIQPKANGWYIGGNLIFGGLIGWLIVDPLTGGMWSLTPQTNENISVEKQTVTIKLLSDLTNEQKAQMTKIK